MKIGLLSDIHSNYDALEIVLERLRKEEVGTLIIAGDSVGYYYSARKVFDSLLDFTIYHVLGNHEIYLLNYKSDSGGEIFNHFGSGISRNYVDLTNSQIEFISNLKHPLSASIDGIDFLISHGAPWNLEQYIYPDSPSEIWDEFVQYPETVFITGHTHHQMLKRYSGKLIINPGSVGQSRSTESSSEWAILDTDNLQVTFFSERYDSRRLIAECLNNDPDFPLLRKHLTDY
jgi:putative phosphoesterase